MSESYNNTQVLPSSSKGDMLELNKDLEIMTEKVENMSVQLTWMAYDMVVLRTNPELGVSMRKLEEAYRKCSTAVYGGPGQEPQGDTCSKTDTIELTEM